MLSITCGIAAAREGRSKRAAQRLAEVGLKIPTEQKMVMKTGITTTGACSENAEMEDVLKELAALQADLVAAPAMSHPSLDDVHSTYRDSARNLLHYLALRTVVDKS